MENLEKLLNDYISYLEVEKNRSPKTSENYKRYLTRFLEQTKARFPRDITAEAVRDFRLSLSRSEIKKITQSYYVIALRNFLKYLIKRGIEVLPPETIELPKVSRRDIEVLSSQELERILKSPQGSDLRTLRDRAILETFFSTGLRLSELCSLSRYLDLKQGEISVRGKGDKVRVVFLAETAKKALQSYLEKRSDTDEALFVSLTKKGIAAGRITPRSVERVVDRYARAAGVAKKVHPHQFRHSFATDLLMNGADIRSVQEMLGHANISTTQVYTHITNRELKEIHKTFHARRRSE